MSGKVTSLIPFLKLINEKSKGFLKALNLKCNLLNAVHDKEISRTSFVLPLSPRSLLELSYPSTSHCVQIFQLSDLFFILSPKEITSYTSSWSECQMGL